MRVLPADSSSESDHVASRHAYKSSLMSTDNQAMALSQEEKTAISDFVVSRRGVCLGEVWPGERQTGARVHGETRPIGQ